jgi:hypothetical protein
LSYDNDSVMDDGSVRESYWTNLEAVRAACKNHGLDFWNIVPSVAHFSYPVNNSRYRAPAALSSAPVGANANWAGADPSGRRTDRCDAAQ